MERNIRTRRRPRQLGLEAPVKQHMAQHIADVVALSLQQNQRYGVLPRAVMGKQGTLASTLRLAEQNVADMMAYLQRRKRAEVAAIVEVEREHGKHGNEEANVCVICLDGNLETDQVEALPCGHVFHGHCIAQWLLCRRVCPVDRRPVD